MNVNGADLKLIGHAGRPTLQYLVNLAVNKDSEEKEKIIIDIGVTATAGRKA